MTYDFTLSYCFVSLLVGAYVYFRLYGKLRRDWYRSEIRDIRDDLFDFVWKNGYSYDEPAYREARNLFNSMLKVSNHLSPTLLVISSAAVLLRQQEGSEYEGKELNIPEGPLGDKIKESYILVMKKTFDFAFRKGLFGLFVKLVVLVSRLFRQTVRLKNFAESSVKVAIERLRASEVIALKAGSKAVPTLQL